MTDTPVKDPNVQSLLSETDIMALLVSGMVVLAVLCVLSCLVAAWSAWKDKDYRR